MHHHRRSIRLGEYNYAQPGAYFVTVCAEGRHPLFGSVENGEIILNTHGRIVHECWLRISELRPGVELDEFVVMPNHMHGILMFHQPVSPDRTRATRWVAPTRTKIGGGAQPGSLGAVIGQFKAAATRRINAMRQSTGSAVWQRNYYERVIRDERELDRVRQYIVGNPSTWLDDEYYVSS